MSADPGIPGVPPPPGPPGRPAPRQVPEALAAGFTHGDQVPGARGFAAGGPLDQMEPGPALAGFTADAAAGGLAVLDDDQLVGVLCVGAAAGVLGGVDPAAGGRGPDCPPPRGGGRRR